MVSTDSVPDRSSKQLEQEDHAGPLKHGRLRMSQFVASPILQAVPIDEVDFEMLEEAAQVSLAAQHRSLLL